MASPGPAPSTTLDDVLAVFARLDQPCTPLTASEVADELGCARRTAFGKLEALAERGDLRSKKAGARGRVWWRPHPSGAVAGGSPSHLGRTQFESFVRAVVDYAIFTLDADGRIASWNEGAKRIKGYDEAAVLGEHVSIFYTDEDVERGVPERNLQGARERGRLEDEGWRVTADGTRFWADVVITAIRDDDGELQGFTKVTRDMTGRREREQALRRERDLLDEVLETSPVAIAVTDGTGELVRANGRAQATMGLDDADLDGHTLGSLDVYDEAGALLPPEERPSGRALRTGESVVDQHLQVERPGGERRWLSVNATPIRDGAGEVERVVLAAEDVTRLKEQARRLERQRDDLEAELDEVFDRVTDAFYALDEDWRFTHVNEEAEAIIQRDEAEVLGERLWDEFPAAADGVVWDQYHEAMETQEAVSFELLYGPLDVWVEVTAYPSETGLSVYFRDVSERKERERELAEQRERYRRLVEAAPVAIAVFGADGELEYVNGAAAELVGADGPEDLVGETAKSFVHPDDRETAVDRHERVIERRELAPPRETKLVAVDGTETRDTSVTMVPITYEGEPASQAVLADITDQKKRERQLARQREQLAALNQLNGVVQDITHAAIETSTREATEELVCERLADADAYRAAWVGAIDREGGVVRRRTAAGDEGYLQDVEVPLDDRATDPGPTAAAATTGAIHVAQRLQDHPAEAPWRDHALEHGLRSLAAIPIEYEDTIYGILTVGSARPDAFDPDESDVVVQLGRVVGHALTAIERKRALVSEEVVELQFRVRGLLDELGVPAPAAGTITFERTVPAGEDTYLEYGTVTGDAVESLEGLVDRLPHLESVQWFDDGGDGRRFELVLSESPVRSVIASFGGRVEAAVVEGGDYDMTVHVPRGTDVRELVEAVRSTYPDTEVVAQRQTTRTDRSGQQLGAVLDEGLTDRQRAALEAAFFGGFFNWPRDSKGEDIADALQIAPSTFHQHVRAGERKIMRALFEDAAAAG